METIVAPVMLAVALFAAPLSAAVPANGVTQTTTQATPADGAPFVGEWTLTLQGPNGPGTFGLLLKVEKDKLLGELTSEALPKQAITDITKSDKGLLLSYSFTWEGNPVNAVISLTPEAEGKTSAAIDFANGAYIMTGSATKKEPAK